MGEEEQEKQPQWRKRKGKHIRRTLRIFNKRMKWFQLYRRINKNNQ